MIDNCRVIEEDSTGITIEIGLFEHCKLLEDLTNNFFTKKKLILEKLKKNWTCLFCREFLTIKISNGFWKNL